MLKTITQTEEEYGESIQIERGKKRVREKKDENRSKFSRTIRTESNNGTKAGGKKTLALPTDLNERKKIILNQNNKHGTGSEKRERDREKEIFASMYIMKTINW